MVGRGVRGALVAVLGAAVGTKDRVEASLYTSSHDVSGNENMNGGAQLYPSSHDASGNENMNGGDSEGTAVGLLFEGGAVTGAALVGTAEEGATVTGAALGVPVGSVEGVLVGLAVGFRA